MLQKCPCYSKNRTVPPEQWKIYLNFNSLDNYLKLRVLNVTTTFTGEVRIVRHVKFTLEQATKTQRGSRGIALLFL